MIRNLVALTTLLFVVCIAMPSTQTLAADQADFSSTIPFITQPGHLGFFNQKTGKVYIYDKDFKTCIFSGKLSELGKDIEVIEPLQTTKKK